jgi:hypothetical protein
MNFFFFFFIIFIRSKLFEIKLQYGGGEILESKVQDLFEQSA